MANQRRYPQTFDVFVGNLPEDCDQKKLGKLFNKFGEIAAIIVRNANQPGTKFAFIKYLCEEDAQNAIEEAGNNRFEMDGNKLIVRRSESRKRPYDVNFGKDKPNPGFGLSQKEPDLVSNLETASNASSKDLMEDFVQITHAETPITVFAQISSEENLTEIRNVLQQLAELCPTAPQATLPLEYSKVYAAKFSEDDLWYRCQVRQNYSPNKVKIQFIDYGNSEDIDPANIVQIPEEITNYSPFAQKLVLHNLRSKDLSCPKGTAFLQNISLGKVMRAVFKRRLTDGSGYYAELFDDGESVIDKVIAEGHGILRQTQKPLNSQNNNLNNDAYTGGYNDNKLNYNRNAMRDNNNMMSVDKRRELEKITTERDMLNIELSNMRSKMKTLQSEYQLMSNKLMENNLGQLVKMIMNVASKVKHLRSQFPVDRNTPLDDGLDLIQDDANRLTNIQVDSLPTVVSTLSTYKAAQKEISLSKDQREIDEMIKTRDLARVELYEKLKVCVGDLQNYPFEERGQKVKKCLDTIEQNYSFFLALKLPVQTPLPDILPLYKDWKIKKKEDFEESRKVTDLCKLSVLSSISEFHNLLSLDEETAVNTEVNSDLDGLLKQYLTVLQCEITRSDTEQGRDAPFLASIVQSIHKELHQESSSIDNYIKLMSEFRQTVTDIEPWLENKPTTTGLQSTRKTLRSLKSKLRHRLADKVDYEENEGEGGELDEIKTDINEIRNKIHEVLLVESEQISEIAKLAENHFPEVVSEFSEFGIDEQLLYQGLVQNSYEIDHFDLNPVLEGCNDLYESVFCGEIIYIREYLLTDGDHLNKDQFLSQAFNYYQINNDYLHKIDTIFFNKAGRRGYIKSSKDGEILVSVLDSGIRPNSKAIQEIIRCVSKAIGGLHSKSYIHGDITPESIFMRDDGTAVLLEPDFSRSASDRCRKKYTTKSGLEFIAPEVRNSGDVTPSVDLFHLGLLILWLHYPECTISLSPDNAPDFSHLPLDQSTQMILRSLLNSAANLRPNIDVLLQSPYHTLDLPDNLITSPHYPSPSPTSMAGMGNNGGFNYASFGSTPPVYPVPSQSPIYSFPSILPSPEYCQQMNTSVAPMPVLDYNQQLMPMNTNFSPSSSGIGADFNIIPAGPISHFSNAGYTNMAPVISSYNPPPPNSSYNPPPPNSSYNPPPPNSSYTDTSSGSTFNQSASNTSFTDMPPSAGFNQSGPNSSYTDMPPSAGFNQSGPNSSYTDMPASDRFNQPAPNSSFTDMSASAGFNQSAPNSSYTDIPATKPDCNQATGSNFSNSTDYSTERPSDEPFEIGTFDLEAAMCSIPDQSEDTESTPVNIDDLTFESQDFDHTSNNQPSDTSSLPTSEPLVSVELQKLSIAENTNNSNIEAEKLQQETQDDEQDGPAVETI